MVAETLLIDQTEHGLCLNFRQACGATFSFGGLVPRPVKFPDFGGKGHGQEITTVSFHFFHSLFRVGIGVCRTTGSFMVWWREFDGFEDRLGLVGVSRMT